MKSKPTYDELLELVSTLQSKIKELEEELSKYKNPKHSGNSSVAPSQDPFRKTRSQRRKSNRSKGGQKGHKGSRLSIVDHPDKIITHQIEQCEYCGVDLSEETLGYQSRQVFDIPEIKIEVTQHRVAKKICSCCGKTSQAKFPKHITRDTQYGNNIKSLCVYLQNYQMLPYSRCAELISDLTGHQISTGSLSNFLRQSYDLLEDYEQNIKSMLLQNKVLHADETGVNVNGKNHWVHVISNKMMSYFASHPKRGKQAMNDIGVLEHYHGTLIHDRFSSYFSYDCKHGLCNAHILRDLEYVIEKFDANWAKQIKTILLNTKKEKDKNPNIKSSYYSKIENEFENLTKPIIDAYDNKYKKTDEQKLAFALQKHKALFLKFLKESEVPFDNNQAERDLRMIKVKQKISGCFRSEIHANIFTRIRGYISTAKKNEVPILKAIKQAFQLNPFLPKFAE